MKIVAPLILLLALFLSMSSTVDICVDGDGCCDEACTDCFVCFNGGIVSMVAAPTMSAVQDLPVIGNLTLPSPQDAFAGYTFLPDIPPRSLS